MEVTASQVSSISTRTLAAGANLIGFPNVPPGYDAYLLLQKIGGASTVSSVQRFNPVTGAFETTGYFQNQPVGPAFPVKRGEGYSVNMKRSVNGVSVP